MTIETTSPDSISSNDQKLFDKLSKQISPLLPQYQSQFQLQIQASRDAKQGKSHFLSREKKSQQCIKSVSKKIAAQCFDIIEAAMNDPHVIEGKTQRHFIGTFVTELGKLLKSGAGNAGLFYYTLLETALLLMESKDRALQARQILYWILERKAYRSDEIDIEVNLAMSKLYTDSGNPDLVLIFADMARLLLSDNQPNPKLELDVMRQLKIGTKRQGDYGSALHYSKQALKLARKIYGQGSLEFLKEKRDVGYFLIRTEKIEEAEPHLLDTFARGSEFLEKNDDFLIDIRLLLMSLWSQRSAPVPPPALKAY